MTRNLKCYWLDIKDWFWFKLRKISIKVTSNKAKQVNSGMKLNDNQRSLILWIIMNDQ